MKKKYVLIAVVVGLILLITVTTVSVRLRAANQTKVSVPPRQEEARIAGPGRVEPISEDIQIGSELSGKLKSVNVEEGDRVRKGKILAVLENADYAAQVLSARADLEAKQAALRKVVNGARSQERSEALASAHAAQAVMDNARVEAERRQKLAQAGVISAEELDRYTRAYNVAREQYREAVERHSLIDDRAREEDVALAASDLGLARARLAEAEARYEKTVIRSPIDGLVLRKHHRAGESVSNSSTVPDPVLTIGDTHVLRVRMDVDEADVSRVHVGQRAFVTADAFGQEKFWGRVVHIGNQLGPKNVRTDEPTERVDKKILETLIELEHAPQLRDGLRVDAYILEGGSNRE
jgi:ABC exporter DevB family membrane fusion protein